MVQLKPNQFLNKAYRQVAIERSCFNNFCACMKHLFENIADGQREETQKEHLRVFLSDTFYKSYYMAPEGDIDLAIHLEKTGKSKIGLLIEVKSTMNKNEMISTEDLNKKALQELLLYYLRERVTKRNSDLKYLVATNIYEYFIFDAQVFEKFFYNNSKLRKEFNDFEEDRKTSSKTDFFYSEIAAKYIDEVAVNLDYAYFDIRNYLKYIDTTNSRKLIELYKIFSDTHLLKLPFQSDSNFLNKNFYAELLHIIGIEEQKVNSKIIIVRKDLNRRCDASLLEDTINILDSEDRLDSLPNLSFYGNTHEEQLFTVAMELCITWINRILFLKLLEAQLLKYHNGDANYKFLTISKIKDFDELNRLFFQVLARDYSHRTESITKEFRYVPYLNSSLFEISDLELKTICINNLSQSLELPLMLKSVLKKKKNVIIPDALPTLQYLFEFLDAYNFSSEGTEEIQDDAKTLINASVLGLIFEKINGHKDGAVFTPGVITVYMSHESIERVVINKFNNYYGWNCKSLADLYNNIDNIEEANEIINDLKICDAAVGSGHYLVSSLNELIYIKYELGILTDGHGKRIKKRFYSFTIENDELMVADEDNNIFQYIPGNQECQRIQEMLFNEKRYIIENCLFGVDINPNSVRICRLRLWIELLKNAYYTKESNYTQLETLPNIDINIKCGNSLLHRFDIKESIQSVLRKTGITISEYKTAVAKYRSTSNKDDKKELAKVIGKIKSTLLTEIKLKDKDFLKLQKKRKELHELKEPVLFELSKLEQKVRNKNIEKLSNEIKSIEDYFDEIKNNKIYYEAFEWRIEFPEVLDEDGNFIGFDCVIGNPPYIQLQSMGKDADALERMNYQTYTRTGDIYCLFYEEGMNILKEGGLLCYITSNKWMRAQYGESLRNYFVTKTNPVLLIDFTGNKIFESATVYTNILILYKCANKNKTIVCSVKNKDSLKKLSVYVQQQNSIYNFSSRESWVVLSPIELNIKRKIEDVGTPLKDWNIQIYRGILTGCNDAFIIPSKKRNEILDNCRTEDERQRTIELIQPILRGRDIKQYGYKWGNMWLINTHNGIKGELPRINIENYPAVKDHLDKYWNKIRDRTDQGDTPYNLRNCAYMDDFNKPKIIYPNMTKYMPFVYDDMKFMTNQKCFIITGDKIAFLTAFLNSSLFKYCFRNSFPELQGGTRELSKIFFNKIPVLKINDAVEVKFRSMIKDIQDAYTDRKATEIDAKIFDLYNLSEEERQLISIVNLHT
jgi:adenine-specific DNA-methyltransferase